MACNPSRIACCPSYFCGRNCIPLYQGYLTFDPRVCQTWRDEESPLPNFFFKTSPSALCSTYLSVNVCLTLCIIWCHLVLIHDALKVVSFLVFTRIFCIIDWLGIFLHHFRCSCSDIGLPRARWTLNNPLDKIKIKLYWIFWSIHNLPSITKKKEQSVSKVI